MTEFNSDGYRKPEQILSQRKSPIGVTFGEAASCSLRKLKNLMARKREFRWTKLMVLLRQPHEFLMNRAQELSRLRNLTRLCERAENPVPVNLSKRAV
jgi:hypothetical protein